MLVASLVWLASFFGYTVTPAEFRQQDLDNKFKPSTFLASVGYSWRQADNGYQGATLGFGYESRFNKYRDKLRWEAKYRFYNGNSDFGSKRDHFLAVGLMQYFTEGTSLYIDIGPYWADGKITPGVSGGFSFIMSAFGAGFRPNIFADYVNDQVRLGVCASFQVF